MNIKMYKTVILPFVLCGCETWPLTLMDITRIESDRETDAVKDIWTKGV
jgi:hypothetical protein